MPYDHARKIGNEGDLVKHTVLAGCVDHIFSNSQGKFVYAESHAARAEYVLPKGGSWQNGIGMLDRIAPSHRRGYAKKFHDAFLKDRCCVGGRYLGSHSIAFCLAGQTNSIDCHFLLHDWSQSAVDDLHRFYAPWTSISPPDHRRVQIVKADGYQGVREVLADAATRPNLVVIDPPSLEQDALVKALLAELKQSETDFICWTPRTAVMDAVSPSDVRADVFYKKLKDSAKEFGMQQSQLEKAVNAAFGGKLLEVNSVIVQSAVESEKSRSFFEWAGKQSFGVHLVKWQPWISTRATSGCQITVSENLKNVTLDALQDLKNTLYPKFRNWNFTTL